MKCKAAVPIEIRLSKVVNLDLEGPSNTLFSSKMMELINFIEC
jgi:hypothetical protein